MYGTARHAPKNQYGAAKKADAKMNPGIAADKKLFNAIYGNGRCEILFRLDLYAKWR